MSDLVLTKTPAGALAPADEPTAEYIRKLRMGVPLHGEFTRMRNPQFHRKAFALFKLAFEAWDAPALEYRGEPVAKDFDRFRRDLTILAGHYEAVTNLRGEVRLEAKSLKFARMSEDEFETVYRGVLNTVWEKLLRQKGYANPAAVDAVINELMRFE